MEGQLGVYGGDIPDVARVAVGSPRVCMTLGTRGWCQPPWPLGYTRDVSQFPSRFAKVSFASQHAAKFPRKHRKYIFIYEEYLPLSINGRREVINS